jgi:hypothetical protein
VEPRKEEEEEEEDGFSGPVPKRSGHSGRTIMEWGRDKEGRIWKM